jgi:hypothetical protein
MMDRAELVVLHAALETVLAWPDTVRDQVAAWLAPAAAGAAKGNGLDHRRVPMTATAPPRQAKRKPNAFSAKTAERKLLEAMRDNPSMSVVGLANASNASRSGTGERLRQLAERGVVEKSATGRWRLAGEKVVETTGFASPGTEADPTQPPSP